MRMGFLAAGACCAAFGLVACDQTKDSQPAATASTAPAAPKYVGRSQQMYQGQELISKVDSGEISLGKGGALDMKAAGSVPMAGYKNAGFLKRIYAAPPKDGVYEMDVVADRPANGTPAATPIEVKGEWPNFPGDRLKGVRFIAKDNSVVAMLPAK